MTASHSPFLRHAVMRVNPHFYGCDDDEQLRYRMTMPDRDRFLLERHLIKDLFGIECESEEALVSARWNLQCADLERLNEALLPWDGIGDDCFYLNEFLSCDAFLSYETVDDYARDDHEYQENERVRELEDYSPTSYEGNLFPSWARLFVDGRFRYATLWSLAGFLLNLIEERAVERVEQLIPHHLINGPDHGKREGDQYIWDMRPDAGGREAQLEELTLRVYEYQMRRGRELRGEFDRQAAGTVFIQEVTEPETHLYFIFSDKSAMAEVRFAHFLHDCRALARDHAVLAELERRERVAVDAFVEEQHRDIEKNFDPRISRFRRRSRIFVHKDAFR